LLEVRQTMESLDDVPGQVLRKAGVKMEWRRYAKQQPSDGEVVTTCGHSTSGRAPYHFFGFGPSLPVADFVRPDGTHFESRWMILCDPCFRRHSEDPGSVIRADFVWKGNEPEIREDIQ